jgi:hypothetical protein
MVHWFWDARPDPPRSSGETAEGRCGRKNFSAAQPFPVMCSRIMGMMLSHLQKSGVAMIATIFKGKITRFFRKKSGFDSTKTGLSLK